MMTRDEILALEPGPKMDEAVGKLIGATPEITWYAMNREETGYPMSFDSRREAEHWHNDMMTEFPNGRYAENGGHIVRQEIYRRYSEDISVAWEVYLKMMEGFLSQRRRFHANLQSLAVLDNGCVVAWPDVLTVLRNRMPESICKAALLMQEVPK